jgi:hypothetical protein
MALHAEYYDLIWQGLKTHEFGRRFLESRTVSWFVYLNAPVSRLAAVVALGPALVGCRGDRGGGGADAVGERGKRAGVSARPGPGLRDPYPGRDLVPGPVSG